MQQDSDDIVIGKIWLAALDRSTCLKCAARDLLRYTNDFQPIGHHLPWNGGPGKIHRRCRCVALPLLAPEFDKYQRGAMRPSVFDGQALQVPATTTYNDWLRDRRLAFQCEVLGVSRARIWRDYNLHLADLLGEDGLPLKVTILEEKYLR